MYPLPRETVRDQGDGGEGGGEGEEGEEVIEALLADLIFTGYQPAYPLVPHLYPIHYYLKYLIRFPDPRRHT